MRILSILVGVIFVVVIVMYILTLQSTPTVVTSNTPASTTAPVQQSQQDESTGPVEPEHTSSESTAAEDVPVSEDKAGHPDAEYFSAKYQAYLTALNNGSAADDVLAMFSRKWQDDMLKLAKSKDDLLGHLKMMQMNKDYQVDKVEFKTRNDNSQGMNGEFAVLYVKGKLTYASLDDKELTNAIIFYNEEGDWKLSGEMNSAIEQIVRTGEGPDITENNPYAEQARKKQREADEEAENRRRIQQQKMKEELEQFKRK